MEVMKGYKQTEIGVIPNDWEVKSISQFTNPVRGSSPRPAGDSRFFNGDYIPWLTVAALTNIPLSQIYVSETETFLTEAGSHLSRNLEKETLIIANSGATLGVAKLLAIKCCANDGIAALLDFDKNVNKLYVVYYINTKIKYLREVVATGNGQPNLNTELIGLFKIPLPPTIKEQTAIANALSDTDAWINSLEQLLTKKHQIKQGAMQELLQPKDGWEVKTIKQIVSTPITDGPHETPQFIRNGVPFLSVNNIVDNEISWEDLRYISKKDDERFSLKCKPIKNDILLGKAASVGKVAIVKTENDFNIWSPLALIRTKKEYHSSFLFYLLQTESTNIQISYFTNSSSQGNIGMGDIEKITFKFPSFEEQTRIATILSDMDEEIAQLETKLAKAKQIKQGMMQELLTGRIRLV